MAEKEILSQDNSRSMVELNDETGHRVKLIRGLEKELRARSAQNNLNNYTLKEQPPQKSPTLDDCS